MAPEAAILIVDDEERTRVSVARALGDARYDIQGVGTVDETLVALRNKIFDVTLCDIRLGDANGLELQQKLHAEYPDMPVVMITAYADVETAVRALKQGAYDYLSKPFSGEEVRRAVRRALEYRRLSLENESLRRIMKDQQDEVWMGTATSIRRLYEQAQKVAASNASVFISGGTGSGKEILARFIHASSPRAEHPFVAINCAALPETLADSQIFGHVRGAFTGAVSDRRGDLEIASGGTLFLDEIEDLKLEAQAKLLRVLEEGRLRRVGGEREIAVDVRIVAAAQKDPEQLVREGRLREDLFFRIGSVHLRVPPLRERVEDIAGLALHFLSRFSREIKKSIAGLDPEALALLEKYAWPGNVRELKNVIERAAIFVRPGERVGVAELPEKLRTTPGTARFSIDPGEPLSLDEVSERYVRHVLELSGGNQAQCARTLGISTSTLWRYLNKSRKKAGSTLSE